MPDTSTSATNSSSSPEGPTAPPVTPPQSADPAGQAAGQAGTDPAASVDYRALYEQAQAKLGQAEHTAREHQQKAARLDEIEAAQQTEAERAAQRAEAAETQVRKLRARAVEAEIRAAATGWADPTDAPRYLDDRDRYVDQGGEIDTAAITADLAAVLLARPHLTGTAERPPARRPVPDPSQGTRETGPAGLGTQIAEAEKRGDWVTSISLKNQRLTELAAQHR